MSNITSIILECWDANKEMEQIGYVLGQSNWELRIWVSYIMCYGYEPDDVIEYAKKRGIPIDPIDCDPDDETDHYGALCLTQGIVNRLREE